MSKETQIEKQIKEMAREMCGNGMPNGNCATDDEPCGLECFYGFCAERLYCKDYRKQEWISVDERLPMCGELVLVSSMDKITKKHGWFYLTSYDKERKWWNGALFGRVTHWMPLPEPPKGVAE